MMHPNTFVAQTSCAMSNHFYKSIIAANEYDGPAVVSVYTTCQPEHGVGDNMATRLVHRSQARAGRAVARDEATQVRTAARGPAVSGENRTSTSTDCAGARTIGSVSPA